MTQRIHNLSKWALVEEGQSIAFLNMRRRTVILEVNAPAPVCLYVVQDAEDVRSNPERIADEEAGRKRGELPPAVKGDEPVFLAFILGGRERVEFAVDGAFELLTEGGNCYIYTADSQDIAMRVVAPLIYTKIANRRARNPHLELMQYQMRLNQERFQAELRDEMERRIAALETGRERYAERRNQGTPIGGAGEEAGEPERAGSTESVAAATTSGESEDGGKPAGKRAKVATSGNDNAASRKVEGS